MNQSAMAQSYLARTLVPTVSRARFTTLAAIAILLFMSSSAQPLFAAHAPGRAEAGKVTVLNAARVYHPTILKKGTVYKSPAILKTGKIFGAIPEWKEIQRKQLTDKDAEYHLLLKAANDKFSTAINQVQKDKGYDIIAEDTAIKCEKITPADVTTAVINALPKKTK